MADPLRDDIATSKFPVEASGPADQSVAALLPSDAPALLPGVPAGRNLPLPVAENVRLNRAAESIGAALGTTVGKVRSGLTVVYDRNLALAKQVSGRLSQEAESLSAAAVERAESLGNVAEEKTAQLKGRAKEELEELRLKVREQVVVLRRQAQEAKEEHPIELLMAFAATGFVIGIGLRVWRSLND